MRVRLCVRKAACLSLSFFNALVTVNAFVISRYIGEDGGFELARREEQQPDYARNHGWRDARNFELFPLNSGQSFDMDTYIRLGCHKRGGLFYQVYLLLQMEEVEFSDDLYQGVFITRGAADVGQYYYLRWDGNGRRKYAVGMDDPYDPANHFFEKKELQGTILAEKARSAFEDLIWSQPVPNPHALSTTTWAKKMIELGIRKDYILPMSLDKQNHN